MTFVSFQAANTVNTLMLVRQTIISYGITMRLPFVFPCLTSFKVVYNKRFKETCSFFFDIVGDPAFKTDYSL